MKKTLLPALFAVFLPALCFGAQPLSSGSEARLPGAAPAVSGHEEIFGEPGRHMYGAGGRPHSRPKRQPGPALSGPLPALSIVPNIPNMLSSVCSGSPVLAGAWAGPMFLTARHCLPGNSGGRRGAYASGRSTPETKALEFDLDAAQIDDARDLVLAPVTGAISKAARVYSLAEKLPEPGEEISIWGYPYSFFNISLTKVNCAYMGTFFTISPQNTGYTVFQAAQCSRDTSIEGMSGGPVLNSAGELIGLIAMQGLQSKVNIKGTLLIFTKVTREGVSPSPDYARREFIAPLRDGVARHNPVYIFQSSKETPGFFDVVKANYDIPVSNQLAHGVLRAYDQAGVPIDCGLYERGKFVNLVPCEAGR